MPRVGTGRIYQRGGVWWVDYSHRGKRYRESSGSTKKKDAAALLKRRLGEMGLGGDFRGPAEERVTLGDLMGMIRDDYRIHGRRSAVRMQSALDHLREYFGEECRALDVTTDRVAAYTSRRLDAGAARATVARELAALKRTFRLAVDARRLASAPRIHVPTPNNARKGFLEPEDLERVVVELPDYLRPVVRFAAMTGWRKGEVLGLRWASVDFAGGVVRLDPGTTKTGAGREFPLATYPELRELLERERERVRAVERRTGQIVTHVFAHDDGRPIRGDATRKPWMAACERAGVPGAWFHDLRRTAIREMVRAGVPQSTAMALSGHRTTSVFHRYAVQDRAMLDEGVAKLAEYRAARAAGPRKVVPLREREAR